MARSRSEEARHQINRATFSLPEDRAYVLAHIDALEAELATTRDALNALLAAESEGARRDTEELRRPPTRRTQDDKAGRAEAK